MLHSAIASAGKPADCALVLYEKNGGFPRGLTYSVLSLKVGGNQVPKKIPAVAMRDKTCWTKTTWSAFGNTERNTLRIELNDASVRLQAEDKIGLKEKSVQSQA